MVTKGVAFVRRIRKVGWKTMMHDRAENTRDQPPATRTGTASARERRLNYLAASASLAGVASTVAAIALVC